MLNRLSFTPSLHAYRQLKGDMTFCSWRAGWRSLLLRAFDDPPEVEELVTAPVEDYLVVLVTDGSTNIESFAGGRWHGAAYRPGSIGMTAPGESVRLRWRGLERHATLQLHLPAGILRSVSDELNQDYSRRLPSALLTSDLMIASMMHALHQAARSGAPDLYGETAAHFLSAHLLQSKRSAKPPLKPGLRPLRQAEDYMRAHLSEPVSLAELALAAGLSRFQLLRAANAIWRETPMRRLARLRMEAACDLLKRTRRSVSDIALECGYADASHFGVAFRRRLGITPSEFRHI